MEIWLTSSAQSLWKLWKTNNNKLSGTKSRDRPRRSVREARLSWTLKQTLCSSIRLSTQLWIPVAQTGPLPCLHQSLLIHSVKMAAFLCPNRGLFGKEKHPTLLWRKWWTKHCKGIIQKSATWKKFKNFTIRNPNNNGKWWVTLSVLRRRSRRWKSKAYRKSSRDKLKRRSNNKSSLLKSIKNLRLQQEVPFLQTKSSRSWVNKQWRNEGRTKPKT